jgi:uncharacterized protein (DUF1778 family)
MNVRATPRQAQLIRTGTKRIGVSVANFILESACQRAEHVLADRRDFIVSARQRKAFIEVLDRPARIKPQLARLFSEASGTRSRG